MPSGNWVFGIGTTWFAGDRARLECTYCTIELAVLILSIGSACSRRLLGQADFGPIASIHDAATKYPHPHGRPDGRLAVITTGTWLLAQSLGSLAAGAIAQGFGGYAPIGPLGALTCIAAIAVVWPLARRFDAIKAATVIRPQH